MNSELFKAGNVELPNGGCITVVEFMGHPIAEGPAEALDGEGAAERVQEAFCSALVAALSMVMGSEQFGRYAPREWTYWHPMAPPLARLPKGEEG